MTLSVAMVTRKFAILLVGAAAKKSNNNNLTKIFWALLSKNL